MDCCSDHFCKACLDEILNEEWKESKPTPCPLCNQEFTSMPDRDLERELNQKKVCCTHKKIGCEWVGQLSEFDSHMIWMIQQNLVCPLSVDDSAAGRDLRELERCLRVCPKFFISCPNECGSKILQKNLAKHLNKVRGLSAELDLHLKAKSSNRHYGRYDGATFKPTSRHQQGYYSSKPSLSHCKVTPERSQSRKKT